MPTSFHQVRACRGGVLDTMLHTCANLPAPLLLQGRLRLRLVLRAVLRMSFRLFLSVASVKNPPGCMLLLRTLLIFQSKYTASCDGS